MDDVDFPRAADGRRSSSALGRAVVSDALRAVDPVAADAAAGESDWRRRYLPHLRALVEAGLRTGGPDGAPGGAGYDIARAGLDAVHARMRVTSPDGDVTLDEVFGRPVDRPLETLTLGGAGTPERELTVPYRGALLRGDALGRQLDAWVVAGTVERSFAESVREVAANPDWLDLSDQRVVVLGAGSEMGPLQALLGWGGTVVGIDLPRPDLWGRVGAAAARLAGRLVVPVAPGRGGSGGGGGASGAGGAGIERAGVDLLGGLAATARWLLGVEGRLVLGNYVYADGAAYVRLSAAVDALGVHLQRQRPDLALAFLATPTDVFAVPADAVAEADAAYRTTARFRRIRRPVQAVSGGRLLRPNYPAGADPGVNDSLVPQQGPNYALAKRIQRWRATAARAAGTTVSFAVAPPTRTRSVLSNRMLAAAYAGAHRFGVEVFDPATSNRLMAALLVHQLRRPRPAAPAAWIDEAFAAAHGGLWRIAYQPRSALGLAAVLGLPGAAVLGLPGAAALGLPGAAGQGRSGAAGRSTRPAG